VLVLVSAATLAAIGIYQLVASALEEGRPERLRPGGDGREPPAGPHAPLDGREEQTVKQEPRKIVTSMMPMTCACR